VSFFGNAFGMAANKQVLFDHSFIEPWNFSGKMKHCL
jgi:hypothetical protein